MSSELLPTVLSDSVNQISLSIVVPSKNESEYIFKTLTALKKLTQTLSIEITVVDNGSNDNTLSIAKSTGVNVFSLPNTSISAVRNYGAQKSSGKYLAFIDSDVLITEQWIASIEKSLQSLEEKPLQVIGARCHPATNTAFLDKYWFNRLLEYEAAYINSGNLVTSRTLYERILGFDAALTTAEDYDFCLRAKKAGARIVNNEDLVALHLGYPKTIPGFINRERWHGSQDCKDFASLKESKIAWLAIVNLFILCSSTFLSVLHSEPMWIVGYVLILVALGTFLTLLRFKFKNLHLFPFTALLFSLYISGRSLSIIDRIFESLSSALKHQKS